MSYSRTRPGRQVDQSTPSWLIACLAGEIRPAMIEAVRRCHEHFRTGLLTNNFVRIDGD